MKIRDQVFRAVLDIGATLSIVARRLLKTFKRTKTVAIRVGDGRTIHSLWGVDVTICLGDKTVTEHCRLLDTDAFDIVIGTDFLRRNPQVKMLSLQRPYSLHCDFDSGLFSVPLELLGRKESGLCYASKTNYGTENYQLARHALAKVLTKIAYEGGRVVMCTPDWGCSGEHAHWRRMLDQMTVGIVQLPDGPIYVPEDSDTAMQAPEWASFLSIVDGSINPVPLCDLDQRSWLKIVA